MLLLQRFAFVDGSVGLVGISDGGSFALDKKGKVIALLTPPRSAEKPKKIKLPDFEARRKRIFGESDDRDLPGNIIAEERESYEW